MWTIENTDFCFYLNRDYFKMLRLWTVLVLVITSLRNAEGEKQPFVSAPTRDLDSFHTFTSTDSSGYKTLTLQDDTQTLFIGGRDKVFGRNTGDITKSMFQSVMWPVAKGSNCLAVPQSNGGAKCYNQLQVVQPLNSSHIFICGTNSMFPENRYLVTEDGGKSYSLVPDHTNSLALCSFDPTDSVTSLVVQSSQGPDIISTHRPDISSQISLVKMMQENSITSSDTMTGKMSTFVASFTDADATASTVISKVYVVSDEKTEETGMPGRSPTITQVCANDIGGQNKLVNTWTSLLKVGLSCETTDGLKFDLITDMVPGGEGIVYGTFMTRHDTSRTNAVCSFRLWDIQSAFNSGRFWETESKPYEKVSAPGQGPRPGTCASINSTSKDFSIDFLNFMSSHNLVSEVVKPAYPPSVDGSKKVLQKGPLLLKSGEKFAKIAVEQVTGSDGVVYDVIFVGKDNGQILKFVSIEKDGKIETIELAQYQPTQGSIISMKLSQQLGQLYIGTNDGVHQLSTSNCEAYTKSCEFCDPCRMCVLSRDPGCAWDKTTKRCVSVRNKSSGNSLLQDVHHGEAQTQCGDYTESGKTTVKVADDGTEVFGHIITNPSIHFTWFRLKDPSTKEQITSKRGKFRMTTDGQLEITHFDAAEDAGVYQCQYTTGPSKTVLSVSSYNLQAETYVPPLTPVVTVAPKVNGSGSPIDTSGKSGTESPQTTAGAPIAGASVLVGIALGAALLILLIICIAVCCFFRRKKKFSTGNKKYEATPTNGSPRGEENKTNNNNAALVRIQSEFDDRPVRPLLASNDDRDLESNHIDPNQRNAKSLDNILDGGDQLDYIDDDDDAASDKGPTRQSSLRDTTGRQRVPPSRTKSMPGSALYVVYGGKKLMCSTLQRNKQGTWTIQVRPNQSGMSDMAPENDEIIDIINDDSVDGKEIFQPHPDNKTSSSLNTPDAKKKDMKMARKAFFENENPKPNPGSPDSTVQYITSTPNYSGFSKPKIAPKPQHLLSEIKKPLSEQKSRASLRSFGQNSSEDHDSDSTVKGSSSTLKPDTPPTINSNTPQTDAPTPHQHKHHNHHHSRRGVLEEVPTQEPTSDVPNLAAADNKKKSKKLARRANSKKGSLDRSSGSSDGDDHLHGCDKDVKRKNRKTPLDSPSKQSRTSQGSSSSGDYKSARSSVVSEPYPEQR